MQSKSFLLWALILAACLGIGVWSLGIWAGGCASSQQEIVSPTTSTSSTSASSSTTTINTGTWQPVGEFTTSESISITFYDGIPYLEYNTSYPSYNRKVAKFISGTTSWETVSEYGPATDLYAFPFNLFYRTGGRAFYFDDGTADGQRYRVSGDAIFSVEKYNNVSASWEALGTDTFRVDLSRSDFSPCSLYICDDGTPYFAYADFNHNNAITVMKFSSGSWTQVGSGGVNWDGWEGETSYNIILQVYHDPISEQVPYVAFTNNGRASVYKYNSGSNNWQPIGTGPRDPIGGSPGFADAKYLNLFIYGDPAVGAVPYVCFNEAGALSVMRFDGTTWEYVGTPEFTSPLDLSSEIGFSSLYVYNDTPYVAYRAHFPVGYLRARVMKFVK